MIYTTLLSWLFRLRYGKPDAHEPEVLSGLVIVADGIGGLDLCGMALKTMLGVEGSSYRVVLQKWGHGFGRWLVDLTNVANHETQAQAMAEQVKAWRVERPGLPVFLVGKSGGCGIIVHALERLEPEAVEAVVLLAPAVSPEYDLAKAIAAVRREMVVFWSPYDVFILGMGTRFFGTIDRIKTVSAGLVGFRIEHPKLKQVRWQPSMIKSGYFGGHVGPDIPAFLRRYVVPLLTTEPTTDVGFPASVKPDEDRADNPMARG